jgi:hypothetical protein
MKIRNLSAALAASLFTTLLAAPAVSVAGPTDKRDARQEARIDAGVASGEITAREEKRLDGMERRDERAETRAEADGKVTARERARLQARENHNSRKIYRQKHDRQKN